MRFEYDEVKSRINKEKHGIDFVEAQNLWQDENALIVPANIVDEEIRYALISTQQQMLCSHFYIEERGLPDHQRKKMQKKRGEIL
jgi:uncharacterized DUF497 family protein